MSESDLTNMLMTEHAKTRVSSTVLTFLGIASLNMNSLFPHFNELRVSMYKFMTEMFTYLASK